MAKEQNLPGEMECRRAGSALNDIAPEAFDYAKRKRFLSHAFERFDEFEDMWKRAGEDVPDTVRGMLAAGAVFCHSDRTAAFVRSKKKVLDDETLKLVRRWRETPWTYTFFEIGELHRHDLVSVHPLGTRPSNWSSDAPWETLLVHSRSIARNAGEGYRLALALLCNAGSFFSTYGIIVPFSGFSQTDIFYLADVAAYEDLSIFEVPLLGCPGRTTALSDTVRRSPAPFVALWQFSAAPTMNTRVGPMGRNASVIEVDGFPGAHLDDADAWKRAAETYGEPVAECRFTEYAGIIKLGSGSPMYDPVVYVSLTDNRVFLSALTRQGYDRGRAAVASLVDFPEQPESRAGMTAYQAARTFFVLEDELAALEESFGETGDLPDDGEPAETTSEDESPINTARRVMERLTWNHNEGIDESDDRIARDLDVDPEVVSQVRSELDAVFGRWSHDDPDTEESEGGPFAHTGITSADRYGLPPRHFAELTRVGLPAVRGALVTREPDRIYRRIREMGYTAQELFQTAPAMRFADWMLRRSTGRGTDMTPAGYVETAAVREAFEARLIDSPADSMQSDSAPPMSEKLVERLRPKKEADWPLFSRLRRLLETADLLHFESGRLRTSDLAGDMLEDPARLFRHLLETMFTAGEWDTSRYFDAIPGLRRMAPFLFYVAGATSGENGECRWVDVSVLTDALSGTLPGLSGLQDAVEARTVNTLLRVSAGGFFAGAFAETMGLLELSRDDYRNEQFRVTELYHAVFQHASA
ncbi:MAG: hypothetical protein ACOC0B_01465 [bacterium]